jgi:hypothetical protein
VVLFVAAPGHLERGCGRHRLLTQKLAHVRSADEECVQVRKVGLERPRVLSVAHEERVRARFDGGGDERDGRVAYEEGR